MPKLFKTSQAAQMIGIVPETLREKIRTGEIAAIRVGGQWRISEETILQYLKGTPVEANS